MRRDSRLIFLSHVDGLTKCCSRMCWSCFAISPATRQATFSKSDLTLVVRQSLVRKVRAMHGLEENCYNRTRAADGEDGGRGQEDGGRGQS